MTGDVPLWLEAGQPAQRRVGAARLLQPDFRFALGDLLIGPLLARTLRGGLFAMVDGGEVLPRVAVELGVEVDGDRTHEVLVRAVAHASHHGLAQVHSLGRAGLLRWAVVERMQGWPLRALLGRRGLAFTGRRLAALGAELADALRALGAASSEVPLVHGRLSVGHVVVDVTGRARIVGSPVEASSPDLTPDAIGLGTVLACAALGVAPDPRGLTPASRRALSAALDRPENHARMCPALRRLVQSLLLLHPSGFLPSMAVIRAELLRHTEGLQPGVADPTWGRALSDAVRGLPPLHRPALADAEAVVRDLAAHLPGLVPEPVGLRLVERTDDPPSAPEGEHALSARIDGMDLPAPSAADPEPPRRKRFPLLVM
ncbi:hypothetical protein LBMAG42_14290 [Deltaproteobacteria bacterium]|nr:hypothetical protein LBMAG42_14290 [Deltaproteobacteria bacterium]